MIDCNLNIKRVYDNSNKNDGYRILVDRLWPRGLSRSDVIFDEWMKDLAPSTSLRKWFNHEPEKWSAFTWRYQHELKHNKAVADLMKKLSTYTSVTLLYSANDKEHNHAIVLKEFIEGNG
jgi:uncharacterized protein YeaO (DUF488 family)